MAKQKDILHKRKTLWIGKIMLSIQIHCTISKKNISYNIYGLDYSGINLHSEQQISDAISIIMEGHCAYPMNMSRLSLKVS